jgi:hypothetical protein
VQWFPDRPADRGRAAGIAAEVPDRRQLQDVSVAELFGEFLRGLDAEEVRICASPAAELTPEHWAGTTLERLVARNVLEQRAPARYHVPEIFSLLVPGLAAEAAVAG